MMIIAIRYTVIIYCEFFMH